MWQVDPAGPAAQPVVRRPLRLRTEAIQAAVLDVLDDARTPMRPRDVHAAVERHLERPVSKDTIGSYLSVAARAAATPVVRTVPGLYILTRSAGHKRRP
jgi:hypothetical protein